MVNLNRYIYQSQIYQPQRIPDLPATALPSFLFSRYADEQGVFIIR